MMANGTMKSDLIEKGFWGGFVKSFKRSSNSNSGRKKRSSQNATSAAGPVGVEIDTVLLMADKMNDTENPKLESAITNAKGLDFVPDSIKCKTWSYVMFFMILLQRILSSI